MGIFRRNRRNLAWLEDELRDNAPEPPRALVDETLRMIGPTTSARPSSLGVRRALALAFAVVATMSLGLLGGFSYVAHAANSVARTASTAVGITPTQTSATVAICRATGTPSNPYVQETVSKHSLDGTTGPGDLVPAPAGGCPASKGVLTSFNSSLNGGGSGGGDSNGGNGSGSGDGNGGNGSGSGDGNGGNGGSGGSGNGNGGGEGQGGGGGGDEGDDHGGGCDGNQSSSQSSTNGNGHGDGHGDGDGDDDDHCGGGSGDDQYGHGTPICHRTGSTSHPWVLIIVATSALPAHAAHGDIIPAPPAGCPTSAGGGGRTTSINFSVNPTTPGVGDRVTYVIHVTSTPSGFPIGAATCYDGTQAFDTTPVLLGIGLCTETVTSGGPHTIKAVFIPFDQTQFSSSVSANVTVNVAKVTPTAELVTSGTPSNIGAPVTFTATIAGTGATTPTGTVQFLDGVTPLGAPVALSAGVATLATSILVAGSHAITALYAGDATYDTVTSSAVTQVVHGGSLVTVASSLTPSQIGNPVTFTATVGAILPAVGTPAGTVQFLDGATSLGTSTLASGIATFTTSSLALGTHTVTAVYSGSTSFNPATSSAVSQIVNKAASTTTLVTNHNPANAGDPLTLTATVGPVAATGSVQFFDGATSLGTSTLSGGSATLTTSALAAATHSLTATYAGSASYNGSTSVPLSQVVQKAATTTTYTGALSGTTGQSLSLNATVAGAPAGSAISYAYPSGTKSGIAGVATSITPTWTGPATVTVTYAGDATHNASSATLTVTVSTATSVALTSSANPSPTGLPLTITATLTSSAPIPSGSSVSFTDATTSTPLGSAIANGSGQAVITTSSLAAGAHTITASYGGSSTAFLLSSSASLAQTIGKIATSISYTGPSQADFGEAVTFTATTAGIPNGSTVTFDYPGGGSATGTVNANVASATTTASWSPLDGTPITVSYAGDATHNASSTTGSVLLVGDFEDAIFVAASPNPAAFGQSVTLSAALAGGHDNLSNQTTGTMNFFDNGVSVGSTAVSGTSPVSLTYVPSGVGNHSIVVTFTGSKKKYKNQTSSPYTLTVSKVVPTAVLSTSAATVAFAAPVTFTATVTGALTTHPTGSVQFFDGSTALGTGTLSGAGVATLTTSGLASGAHSISAVYAGDALYATKTSNAVAETVGSATSSIAYTGPATGTYNQPLALSATLTNGGAGATLTYAYPGGSTSAPAGTSVSITPTWAGPGTITITYGGDSGHSSATLATSVTVSRPTSVALTSSANPSTTGQSVTLTAALSAPATIPGSPQIVFADGATTLATVTADATGHASYTSSALGIGTHALSATYGGNPGAYFLAGTGSLTQTVNKLATSITYTGPSVATYGQTVSFTATTSGIPNGAVVTFAYPTGSANGTVSSNAVTASATANWTPAGGSTITATYAGDATHASAAGGGTLTLNPTSSASIAVSASPNPAATGQAVTLTATMTSNDQKPTGTVAFFDNAVQVGTGTLGGTSYTTSASYTPSGNGAHSITAKYTSTNPVRWPNATSAAYTETVGKLPTTLGLTASGSLVNVGTSITFTAAVAPAPPYAGAPTGTIQFLDGATVLATKSVASGGATFVAASLSVGTHSITAVYSGDGTFDAKTSSPVSVTVGQIATSTALALSDATPAVGQSVTLTATVTGNAAPVTTGTVTFTAFGFTLGTASLNASGQASLVGAAPAAGTFNVTGVFAPVSGSPYQGSSGSLSVTVH